MKIEKVYMSTYRQFNPVIFYDEYKAEERIGPTRLYENITESTTLLGSVHGAELPQAQRIIMAYRAKVSYKKISTKKLVSILGGCHV